MSMVLAKKRGGYPVQLQRSLREIRKPLYDVLQRLLSPDQPRSAVDQVMADITGLKLSSAKLIRYGNRSLSEDEWNTLTQRVEAATDGSALYKEARASFMGGKEAFLRPYKEELDAAMKRPRKQTRKAKKTTARNGALVRSRRSDATVIEAKMPNRGVGIAINGVNVLIQPGETVRIDVTPDSVKFEIPRLD